MCVIELEALYQERPRYPSPNWKKNTAEHQKYEALSVSDYAISSTPDRSIEDSSPFTEKRNSEASSPFTEKRSSEGSPSIQKKKDLEVKRQRKARGTPSTKAINVDDGLNNLSSALIESARIMNVPRNDDKLLESIKNNSEKG
jgi:hypothetical protein